MRRLAVLAPLLLAGCGGGGGRVSDPSAVAAPPPSGWPAGTTLQILGGDTGQPTQAQVLVNGTPYGGQAAPAGTPLELRAPSYLTRETLVRTGETRFVLWPDSDALPAEYTRALVYVEVALEGGAGRLTPGAVEPPSPPRCASRQSWPRRQVPSGSATSAPSTSHTVKRSPARASVTPSGRINNPFARTSEDSTADP